MESSVVSESVANRLKTLMVVMTSSIIRLSRSEVIPTLTISSSKVILSERV